MINSVNISEQTVTANNNVLFSNDVVRTRSANCCQPCGWLNHSTGSGLFQLVKDGIYEILFNANITSAVAGPVSFAIKSNGEILQGSQMIFTATANATSNVSSSRLVRVCSNGSTTISVGNIGTGSVTVANPNIIIKKVA